MRQRVMLHGVFEFAVLEVRIYLRRSEVRMPEDFLQDPDVDPVLMHEGGGGMPKFMRRIFVIVQVRFFDITAYKRLDHSV